MKGKLDFSAYMFCEKILELYTQQIKQLKSETLDKLKVKAKKSKGQTKHTKRTILGICRSISTCNVSVLTINVKYIGYR